MRNRSYTESFTYWLFADRIPVVKTLILSSLVLSLMVFFSRSDILPGLLTFNTSWLTAQPWTLFTYPLVWTRIDPISMLFAGYWLWIAGGSLERGWGSRGFAIFFLLMSAVTALGMFLYTVLFPGASVGLAGIWLPLAGITVAFAMINPEQQILFFFIIPMKLKYLALLDVVIVFISYAGGGHFLLGIFALFGCAFSYWYIRKPRLIDLPVSRYQDRSKSVRLYSRRSPFAAINPFRWIKDRRERKRLRKLFDNSDFRDYR